MASERQIAANRRNARKSTGPRSGAGRKRVGRNAYRHGLSSSITSNAAVAKQLEKLARRIAGNTEDANIIERARTIAQAELDLARVRRAKVATIARVLAFGSLDPPQASSSTSQAIRLLNSIERTRGAIIPEPVDSATTLPTLDPDRTAEAVRRALPELIKLDRYERRFCVARDHAVLRLKRGKSYTGNP
jgi:hypothetical protein